MSSTTTRRSAARSVTSNVLHPVGFQGRGGVFALARFKGRVHPKTRWSPEVGPIRPRGLPEWFGKWEAREGGDAQQFDLDLCARLESVLSSLLCASLAASWCRRHGAKTHLQHRAQKVLPLVQQQP
eukprot:3583200-Amphidinium_carterae.2